MLMSAAVKAQWHSIRHIRASGGPAIAQSTFHHFAD
jgi:hypothetical protein